MKKFKFRLISSWSVPKNKGTKLPETINTYRFKMPKYAPIQLKKLEKIINSHDH